LTRIIHDEAQMSILISEVLEQFSEEFTKSSRKSKMRAKNYKEI
jgi:hypothetical protein